MTGSFLRLESEERMATLQVQQRCTEKHAKSGQGPHVALITPYSGGNLGDAAIQDSMILNLRERLPNASFLGITLNSENFVRHHGAAAFPMLASLLDRHHYAQRNTGCRTGEPFVDAQRNSGPKTYLRAGLRRLPGARRAAQVFRPKLKVLRQEWDHWVEGYRTLRSQDVLFFSGGGQLDEEYGGAWRLPYTYFKWTLLARLARVPCAMVSVGSGKIESVGARLFISIALRLCCYRSFRETRSKAAAARLFRRVKKDPVIPDLAFSLPESELPAPAQEIRTMACGRPVIALSPIAYGRPVNWPTADRELYQRYVQQMAQVLSDLTEQDYFVIVACSSLGDDESVIPDIVTRLRPEVRSSIEKQIYCPKVKTWRDLVAVLQEVDCLIASRLHGTILGFVSRTPAVAISFDPKVDWVMQDLHQTRHLLHIRDFTAADVLNAVKQLGSDREEALREIISFRDNVLSGSGSASQFDFLAQLALNHYQSRP
jgi:polysaccharide pyruvyl transferase WcaK-like protein